MCRSGVVTVEDLLHFAAVNVEFAGYCPLAVARSVPGSHRLLQERTDGGTPPGALPAQAGPLRPRRNAQRGADEQHQELG